MRRPALITALTLLLATSACGSGEDDGASPASQVPVERTAELADPEGSVLGTALLREEDGDVVLELDAAGLPEGLHDVGLYESGDCDDVAPEAPVLELPRLSVVEDGTGSLSTSVSSDPLGDLLDGDGVTVVVTDANVDASTDSGNDLPGSYLACGAFSG